MATEIVFSCKTYSNNLYQVNRFLSIPLITSCSSKSAHVPLLSLSLVIEESIIFFNCKWIMNRWISICSPALNLLLFCLACDHRGPVWVLVFVCWDTRTEIRTAAGRSRCPALPSIHWEHCLQQTYFRWANKQKSPTKNLRILQQRDMNWENKTWKDPHTEINYTQFFLR